MRRLELRESTNQNIIYKPVRELTIIELSRRMNATIRMLISPSILAHPPISSLSLYLARSLLDIMRLKMIKRMPPSRNRKCERDSRKGLFSSMLYPKDAMVANKIRNDVRRTSLLDFHLDISKFSNCIGGKLRGVPSPPHLVPA